MRFSTPAGVGAWDRAVAVDSHELRRGCVRRWASTHPHQTEVLLTASMPRRINVLRE